MDESEIGQGLNSSETRSASIFIKVYPTRHSSTTGGEIVVLCIAGTEPVPILVHSKIKLAHIRTIALTATILKTEIGDMASTSRLSIMFS